MAATVVKIQFKFLVQDRDRHGNTRTYFRHGGRKVRIREEFGSDAFRAVYDSLKARVDAGAPVAVAEPANPLLPSAGSFAAAVLAYYRSRAFLDLDGETQKKRRYQFEGMLAEPIAPDEATTFRGFPIARMTTATLEILRDRKRAQPEGGNNRVRALRGLFRWAATVPGMLPHGNPSIALTRLRVVSEGHHTWSLAEVEQFEARWPLGTKPRVAMALMLYTGARRSDAVRLGRQHVSDGRLVWTAYKGRNRHPMTLNVPILPELAEALAAGPTGRLMFIETDYGKSFTMAGFGGWFRARCDEAELPQCSSHGLRKAGSTRAAENGATAHELMAMYGWKNLAEAERYTKAADRKRMSTSAAQKLRLGWRE